MKIVRYISSLGQKTLHKNADPVAAAEDDDADTDADTDDPNDDGYFGNHQSDNTVP